MWGTLVKLSIIIPAYNCQEYISRCLNSVLHRRPENCEIIVVDDGSKDRTFEICKDYEHRYNQLKVIHQKNGGAAKARNTGIKAAIGEYLCFVDADDIVVDTFYDVIMPLILENYAQLLMFDFINDDKTECVNESLTVQSIEDAKERITQIYRQGKLNSCCAKMYSRELLFNNSVCFPEGTIVEEDLRFVLRALDASDSIAFPMNEIYCYMRRNEGSVTTSYNPQKYEQKIEAFEEELLFAKKWGNKELEIAFIDKFISYHSSCIMNMCYPEAKMTRKEIVSKIKEYYNSELMQKYLLPVDKAVTQRGKLMCVLIKLKAYNISYDLHRTARLIRYILR